MYSTQVGKMHTYAYYKIITHRTRQKNRVFCPPECIGMNVTDQRTDRNGCSQYNKYKILKKSLLTDNKHYDILYDGLI